MISIDSLDVRIGRSEILSGITLDLPAGVHGLLGPNGAGKTTLIRVLASTLRHDGGTVQVLGRSYDKSADMRWVRERLGYLPQTAAFHRGFTAREYVEYIAWLRRMPNDEIPLAADRALSRVDLIERADTHLRKLSGGMQRRAGLAQAIVNDPQVLLLDEPTAGLDPEQRVQFRALLRELGADSCVVISTHLVEDVAHACDTVTLIDGGRIVARTTPQALAEVGADDALEGDSAIERGYTATLRAHR